MPRDEQVSGPQESASAPVEAPPDWNTLSTEIVCRCCGYNLRSFTSNRCPECGHCFSWGQEIERATLLASPIFEFQARHRPIRSFLHTTFWLLLPWRFWRRVPHALPPRMSALLIQLALTILLSWSLFVLGNFAGPLIYFMCRNAGRWRLDWPGHIVGVMQWYLAPIAAFVMLSWIALGLLWQTRARFRLKQRRLLQITIYSAQSLLLGGAFSFAAIKLTMTIGALTRWWYYQRTYAPTMLALLLFFVTLSIGLGLHMPAFKARRMAALTVVFAGPGILYSAIVSGVWFQSFEAFSNPVIANLEMVMPPLWLWLP